MISKRELRERCQNQITPLLLVFGCLGIIVVMRGKNGKEEEREKRNKEDGKRMRKRRRKNRTSNRIKERKCIMTTIMCGRDRGQWVPSNQ